MDNHKIESKTYRPKTGNQTKGQWVAPYEEEVYFPTKTEGKKAKYLRCIGAVATSIDQCDYVHLHFAKKLPVPST